MNGRCRPFARRNRHRCLANRDVLGSNSPTFRPGTVVAMDLSSPRTSTGASGLGSQVECWAGPPNRNSTMHDLARPRRGAASCAAACRNKSGSVKPATPSDPIRSISRRDIPSHNRAGCDSIVNMVVVGRRFVLLHVRDSIPQIRIVLRPDLLDERPLSVVEAHAAGADVAVVWPADAKVNEKPPATVSESMTRWDHREADSGHGWFTNRSYFGTSEKTVGSIGHRRTGR